MSFKINKFALYGHILPFCFYNSPLLLYNLYKSIFNKIVRK